MILRINAIVKVVSINWNLTEIPCIELIIQI